MANRAVVGRPVAGVFGREHLRPIDRQTGIDARHERLAAVFAKGQIVDLGAKTAVNAIQVGCVIVFALPEHLIGDLRPGRYLQNFLAGGADDHQQGQQGYG
jgi:hypothetical protein